MQSKQMFRKYATATVQVSVVLEITKQLMYPQRHWEDFRIQPGPNVLKMGLKLNLVHYHPSSTLAHLALVLALGANVQKSPNSTSTSWEACKNFGF